VPCAGTAACALEPGEDDEADEVLSPIVRSEVRVLDAEPGVDVEVSETELVASPAHLPELAEARPGDVVVSGRAGGFWRRVHGVRVEGDRIVAETEQASLEDLFEQVRLRGHLDTNEVPELGPPGTGGLGPERVTVRIPHLPLKGRTISIGEGSEIEIVDGDFAFDPELDFDLTMRNRKVERVKVFASGTTSTRLHVRYHLEKPDTRRSGPFLRLRDQRSLVEAPPAYAVFWAGAVPVVVSVRARLLVGWRIVLGGEVSGEEDASATGRVAAGLEYRDGGWRNLGSNDVSLSREGSATVTEHTTGVDLNLTARLDVSFYELAGPYVGLQAYAGFGHQGSDDGAGMYFQSGVRGLAGAEVAAFGRAFVGYESVLFDRFERHPIR
jgi:hypothetical protein